MPHLHDSATRATILVVDDTADNLILMSGLLKDLYKVKVANTGEKALRYVQEEKPDLILLDIMMPGLSGYDVLCELRRNAANRHIPVIFLTAMSTPDDEKKGLELGGADYITKPISPPILLARIRTQLENKAAADFLRDKNEYLEAEVSRRTREIIAIQEVTILVMAALVETRDPDTGHHILRTQHYVRALAEKLKHNPRFSLSGQTIEMLFKSAPLHDIGKVGIPDSILLKPDRLTAEEFEIMKAHTTLGRQAIEAAEKHFGKEVEFLKMAKTIACNHHEKWDGSGYPAGLAGDDIPIPARLMALADVYDALISHRVYKEIMSHEMASEIIAQGKGVHFDPEVAEAFFALQDEFRAIAMRFADGN